jgi:hypothetical protein
VIIHCSNICHNLSLCLKSHLTLSIMATYTRSRVQVLARRLTRSPVQILTRRLAIMTKALLEPSRELSSCALACAVWQKFASGWSEFSLRVVLWFYILEVIFSENYFFMGLELWLKSNANLKWLNILDVSNMIGKNIFMGKKIEWLHYNICIAYSNCLKHVLSWMCSWFHFSSHMKNASLVMCPTA